MQPSSSYHYNKHVLTTNNGESGSSTAHRSSNASNSSTGTASWKQLGVQSSHNNSSSNHQSQHSSSHHQSRQVYTVQHQNQHSQPTSQQQQQSWKRPYQKYSSQPVSASQVPDRSTSPPSPKFVAFTDTEGGSPPPQRYKTGTLSFQPPSLHSPLMSKMRHSGNSNNCNGNSTNDLEDGELT